MNIANIFKKQINIQEKETEMSAYGAMGSGQPSPVPMSNQVSKSDHLTHALSASKITFNLYKAHGGFVVEYRKNSREYIDNNLPTLHVIPDGKDLGEELSKILSFEGLYE